MIRGRFRTHSHPAGRERLWLMPVLCCGLAAFDAAAGEPLVLQDMAWPQVKRYLKTNDMVIIPLGATEQHGPHMPLGTDSYEALEMAKLISAKSQVIVAPVILAGHSAHHLGFAGTVSLKPQTLQAVLMDTAESLIQAGFRRFLFFNYHGGNSAVETAVIQGISQTTPAAAVRIGIGAHFFKPGPSPAPHDYHAGVAETSTLLFLKPDLVDMTQARRPAITLPSAVQRLVALSREHPDLAEVLFQYVGTPAAAGKGGASHEISDNGILSLADPRKASKALGQRLVKQRVEQAVAFIDAWKKVPPD